MFKFLKKLGFNIGRNNKVKLKKKEKRVDTVLWITVIGLLIFGLVMITSIGVPKSIQLSAPDVLYPNCDDAAVDCYLLLRNHFIRMLIGLFAMIVMAKLPYIIWKKTAPVWYIATIIVLVLVLFLGAQYTTFARSWIVLFNTSLQPTEFAKLAMIFYLGYWLDKKKNDVDSMQNGFLPFIIITGALILPVVLQPDLGSTLVIALIAAAMYFVGGANLKHIFAGGLIVGLLGLLVVVNVPHVQERFTSFVNSTGECREDACWQSEQSKLAVGSAGFWGKGLTQGVQKSYWLPQATDDFIFAASAEELGFRIAILIIAYAVIGYRGFLIAKGAENNYVKLVATGITSWIFFQAFINIAVNLALVPVTGITLPFVSYGGSSMLAMLIATGVLLQLSKHSNYENNSGRRGNGRSYYA